MKFTDALEEFLDAKKELQRAWAERASQRDLAPVKARFEKSKHTLNKFFKAKEATDGKA